MFSLVGYEGQPEEEHAAICKILDDWIDLLGYAHTLVTDNYDEATGKWQQLLCGAVIFETTDMDESIAQWETLYHATVAALDAFRKREQEAQP